MKKSNKIISILIIIALVLSTVMIFGCEKESVDDQYLSAMKKGLQSRWNLTDSNENSDKSDSKEAWKSYFDAEYNEINRFKSKKFENKKLQKTAKEYIGLIQKSEDALKYFDNDAKFAAEIDDITNQRAAIIYELHKSNKLDFDDKYKDDASDMYETGKTYLAVQKILKTTKFKLEKNDYGYKTYSAVVKNTTSDDFNYFAFNININDKDGVTVETTTASTDNWEAGTKHRFEFGTEKSFKSIEIESCSWNYD